jgi:hypothetical protein
MIKIKTAIYLLVTVRLSLCLTMPTIYMLIYYLSLCSGTEQVNPEVKCLVFVPKRDMILVFLTGVTYGFHLLNDRIRHGVCSHSFLPFLLLNVL